MALWWNYLLWRVYLCCVILSSLSPLYQES